MTPYISKTSVEFLRASVTSTLDPTIGTVSFSFSTDDQPATWYVGEWEGPAVQSGGYFTATARILVGPSHVELPEGHVAVWVRANSAPEAVVKPIGTIKVW